MPNYCRTDSLPYRICLLLLFGLALTYTGCTVSDGERTDLEIVEIRAASPDMPACVGESHGLEVDVRNNGAVQSLPFIPAYQFARRDRRIFTPMGELQLGPWSEGLPPGATKTFRIFVEPEEAHVSPADEIDGDARVFVKFQLAEPRSLPGGGRTFREMYQDPVMTNHEEYYSAVVARPAKAVELEYQKIRINQKCFAGKRGEWSLSFTPWIRGPQGAATYGEQMSFPGPTTTETRRLPLEESVPIGVTHRFAGPELDETVGSLVMASKEGTSGTMDYLSSTDFDLPPVTWSAGPTPLVVSGPKNGLCSEPPYELEVVVRPVR